MGTLEQLSCNHQVLNASRPTGSLQFCHPPSLPQEACTSAIHPASGRPVPCSRESHAAASPRSRGRGMITFRPCRKKHFSALARTQARQPLGGRRAQGSRATLRPGPVRLQYGSWAVVFSQNSLSAVAARTTRQVVMAVKYSAAGASVCTDCDAGKQEAL